MEHDWNSTDGDVLLYYNLFTERVFDVHVERSGVCQVAQPARVRVNVMDAHVFLNDVGLTNAHVSVTKKEVGILVALDFIVRLSGSFITAEIAQRGRMDG